MYRQPDQAVFQTFASHISIAEALLGVHQDLLARLWREPDLRDSYLRTWGELWDQLDEARAIVGRLERDGQAYDLARQHAGDPHLVAAGMIPIKPEMRDATLAAITALRACAPEVVVPGPVPEPVDAVVGRRWFGPTFWFTVILAVVKACAAMSHVTGRSP